MRQMNPRRGPCSGKKASNTSPLAISSSPMPAEDAGRVAVRQPSGDRSGDRQRQWPGVMNSPVSTTL